MSETKENSTFSDLIELEKKVCWLSNLIIHNANNIRKSDDDAKVGGHQASCASVTTIMVILYFKVLSKFDRVAVKPHASPVYHAIQYLLGNQTLSNLKNFRKLLGAQAYPSITKDFPEVDFSTGSVGLGGAMTIFSSINQDLLKKKMLLKKQFQSKMISIFGDAELDEGNIYEALLEGTKQNLQNCWWIIDYNRQSLDGITHDKSIEKMISLFTSMGWNVEILKYGNKLRNLNTLPGGKDLLKWIDDCPNDLFSALTFKGGYDWRQTLNKAFAKNDDVKKIIKSNSNDELSKLMTNLGGHDFSALDEAFTKYKNDKKPTCFICYTVKGFGLPLAGHKDNHSGIMNFNQFEIYQKQMGIEKKKQWDKLEGINIEQKTFDIILSKNPLVGKNRVLSDKNIKISLTKKNIFKRKQSTQEVFGKIMYSLAKENNNNINRIITTSPDVTSSTNLGPWVNQRNIFDRLKKKNYFYQENIYSSQKWKYSSKGQHIELGIAENNFFLLLAALGISDRLFGVRILPVGTIYDTFIGRGLDALNYATYVGARFILVGTPSGITLSHEGGAHQSITTPNIGISQPNIIYFEPSFGDELEFLLIWALNFIQEKDGSSIYFRLTTKKIKQPKRVLSNKQKNDILLGAYWYKLNGSKLDIIIVTTGVMIDEVMKSYEALLEDNLNIGVLLVVSPDKLCNQWKKLILSLDTKSHIEKLLQNINISVPIITIIDGHHSALSWIGAVLGHRVYPLGVDKFGQSGNLAEVYEDNNIDFKAIIDNIARSIVR